MESSRPLAWDEEDAACSPSPYLGKGLGDGDALRSNAEQWSGHKISPTDTGLTPVELLQLGDLVLTHRNHFMPIQKVISREYVGEMLEIRFHGCSSQLHITSEHRIATPATRFPKFVARVSTARTLRKKLTPSEALLWSFLRDYRTGVKFRRQYPMGTFILDFYAPEVRLAIEVDGSIHELAGRQKYDALRQELIEQCEVELLRFSNEQVKANIKNVLEIVTEKARERLLRFDHRIRWMPAGELEIGTSVFADGVSNERTVSAIRRFATRETVYNLEVGKDNSYATACCTLHN